MAPSDCCPAAQPPLLSLPSSWGSTLKLFSALRSFQKANKQAAPEALLRGPLVPTAGSETSRILALGNTAKRPRQGSEGKEEVVLGQRALGLKGSSERKGNSAENQETAGELWTQRFTCSHMFERVVSFQSEKMRKGQHRPEIKDLPFVCTHGTRALCFPSWVSPCRQPRSTSPPRAASWGPARTQRLTTRGWQDGKENPKNPCLQTSFGDDTAWP